MRFLIALTVTALILAAANARGSETYPVRPIRLIVPFPTGGTTDTLARPVARQVESQLGRNIVVDNRSGANGLIGAQLVSRASPDGYTMLWTTTSIVISQAIIPTFPLDLRKDLEPVTLVAVGAGYFLLVNPALGIHSVKELIALAKNKDKPLTYGTPGVGSGQQIVGELFNQTAGTHLLHVPYKGIPQQINALLGREINVLFIPPTVALPFVKDGRLQALAFAGSARWSEMPELPTVAEAGVPEFRAPAGWHGWFMPPNTPKNIVVKIRDEVHKAVHVQKLREIFLGLGYSVIGNTPDEFRAHIASELKRYVQIARAANIKVE